MNESIQVANYNNSTVGSKTMVGRQPGNIVALSQTPVTALTKPGTQTGIANRPTNLTNGPVSAKNSKAKARIRLPIILEAAIALSWVVVLFTGIIATWVTFRSRSSGLEFILRSGSVTLVTGVLFLVFTWIVARGSYEIMQKQLKEAEQVEETEDTDDEEEVQQDLEETETENTNVTEKGNHVEENKAETEL